MKGAGNEQSDAAVSKINPSAASVRLLYVVLMTHTD